MSIHHLPGYVALQAVYLEGGEDLVVVQQLAPEVVTCLRIRLQSFGRRVVDGVDDAFPDAGVNLPLRVDLFVINTFERRLNSL